MSILENAERFPLSEFNGVKPLIDSIDLDPGDAIAATNCRFSLGKVYGRAGLKSFLSTGLDYVSCPYYYAQGMPGLQTDYLAFGAKVLSSGDHLVVVRNLTAGSSTTIKTVSGGVGVQDPPNVSFAAVGGRLYAALSYINSGVSYVREPYVWDGNTSNQMIACFQRPMLTTEVTEALTQPGAGVVTAGTHYVGVLFQTKAGYWTRPGPADSSLVLQPQSIASTGANNVRVTLTPVTTWPAWIANVQVIMTTIDNEFQYYVVPGTITPVTAGGAGAVTIDLNISDEHLTAIGSQGAGTLADDYFSLLSMNGSNVSPISSKGVVPWGQRLVWVASYGGTDCLFASDPLNPEWISADQHLLQLPGAKAIGSVFVMRGVLYAVSSAGGLYSWVDNGGRPASFSPPTTIDEAVSVPGMHSTTVAASGGYALIASPSGLYAFSGGALANTPISYLQSPLWDDVSWPTALSVDGDVNQVIDLPVERLIVFRYISASAIAPRMLVWDYGRGLTPEKVRCSPWNSTVDAIAPVQPALAYVKISNIWQLLLGTTAIFGGTASFYRLQSTRAGDSGAGLYTDGTAGGIDWQYQTAPLPELNDSPILQHLAVRFRAKALTGTPSVYVSAKSLDNVRTISLALSPIALGTAPGKEYGPAFYDAQEERVSYLFTNNSVAGAGIELARLTHFYNFFAEQR